MKLRLKILNIFYLLFSVVAIGAYVLNSASFMSATFTYEIDAEYFYEESIDDSALSDLGIDSEELFSDLNKITFDVDVNLSYTNLLQSWTETGPEYNRSYMSAIERYSAEYVFIPAFRKAADYLQDDLEIIANNAMSKAIEKIAKTHLDSYCLAVIGHGDSFEAMKQNPQNVDNLNEHQFSNAIRQITENMALYGDADRFYNDYNNKDGDLVFLGLKKTLHPYFTAVKEPEGSNEENALLQAFTTMIEDVDKVLGFDGYQVFDEEGNYTDIEEAIGNILQRFIDHVIYEDVEGSIDEDDEEEYEYESKFVNKLFAPLKAYIEGENDFDEEDNLAELFFNVIKNSTINENSAVFFMIALAARVFAVLLVLFVLAWAIKFIMVIISFFRQKPYIKMNPLFIITGTIEALLALLTLGSVIIYKNFDIEALRKSIPLVQAVVPLGLSFQFIFACWIPGVVAILNLLFSIVYGPVKKKFKQDSRDEILYSTDFNDYE